MPIGEYFEGSGKKVLANMQKEYGAKKGKSVFYATANKRNAKPGQKVKTVKRGSTRLDTY